jgi:hypothetical protein
MATDKNNDFTLTHYLNLAAQRDTTLDQVPFFLGSLKHHPPVLRRMVLEAILAVIWSVTDIDDGDSEYDVVADDVVILVDSTSAVVEINLPSVSTSAGRVLVVKDSAGGAETNAITVDPDSSDTIDGSNTSFVLSANFSAVVFIAGNGSEWHTIALV